MLSCSTRTTTQLGLENAISTHDGALHRASLSDQHLQRPVIHSASALYDPRAPHPGSFAGCHSQLLASPVWLHASHGTRPEPAHVPHFSNGPCVPLLLLLPGRRRPSLPRPLQAGQGSVPDP